MPHIDRKIANYPGSYALLSRRLAVDTAIVFVHGFWGDSITTWRKLRPLIDSGKHFAEEIARSDFYFYDFKTRVRTLNGHGTEFQKFLGRIFPRAPEATFAQAKKGLVRSLLGLAPLPLPEMERTGPLSYDRLVLVGHSMGGVVARRALLNDLTSSGGSSPYTQTRLRLFAPAQAGFRQKEALDVAMSVDPVSGFIYALFLLGNRAFNDLQPGSPALQELERDHNAMAAYPARCARVAWADNDYVVFDTRLTCDAEDRVPDKNHRTICKTREDYLLPLEMILR